MELIVSLRSAFVGAVLICAAVTANATPALQLGITGGTYNTTTQTIVATSKTFSLYAYLNPASTSTLSDNYFLSMALTPQVSTASTLGSFTYNMGSGSTTVNATTDMVYGTPPIERIESLLYDAGDLPPHDIFPTYFAEKQFRFSATNQSGDFDTAANPGLGPQTGTGLYFQRFDIDVSKLSSLYAIHFDLYNETVCAKAGGQCSVAGDIDINKFAPFSHDAQSGLGGTVPEPGTLLLLGIGLIGLGFIRKGQRA